MQKGSRFCSLSKAFNGLGSAYLKDHLMLWEDDDGGTYDSSSGTTELLPSG